MNSFRDQCRSFGMEVEAKNTAVFQRIVELTRESIVVGSPITGAPGQPVGQYGPGYHPGKVGGSLRASFITERPSESRAAITSHLPYAEPIEEGIGPHGALHLRSSVGGFHSVKLTVAGFDRIAAEAARTVAGA